MNYLAHYLLNAALANDFFLPEKNKNCKLKLQIYTDSNFRSIIKKSAEP